jgi:hypothetical protein
MDNDVDSVVRPTKETWVWMMKENAAKPDAVLGITKQWALRYTRPYNMGRNTRVHKRWVPGLRGY